MNDALDPMSGVDAWPLAVLAAPFMGSLLGVLIVRLPEERPVLLARSRCDHCGRRLSPMELVPLLSFLVLRGRCRTCRQPIGWLAPAVEVGATSVAVWAATVEQGGAIWLSCLLGWTLLTCAWIDLRTMLLPDLLTLPLLAGGLAVTAMLKPDLLFDHALAAALGYLLLFALAMGYRALRGQDGLGLGDAKLLAALGAWVGLGALPVILLLAAAAGLAWAGCLRLVGHQVTTQTPVPFGPFLAIGGWLMWLYGDTIVSWVDRLIELVG